MTDSDLQKKMKQSMEETIFVDCAVLNHDYFAVIAEIDMGEDYDPWKKLPTSRIFTYVEEKIPENSFWGGHKFGENTFKWPKIAHTNPNEMIVVGERGEVWYHGLGDNKQFEESISESLIMGISDIKNIHGTIYIVGVHRAVVRREGIDQWVHISKPIEQESLEIYRAAKKKGKEFDSGFNCIDGFSADKNLYAGGGQGDVWRYDGRTWHSVDIPLPKMHINSLCCASDGYVYIAGRFGTLLKGREDEWHILKQEQTKADFKDIVDYQGTLYVCTERRLFTINDQGIQRVDFGDIPEPFSFRSLYVNHGKLMSAGSYNACIYDGQRWQSLYGSQKVDEIMDLNILKQVGDSLENTLDDLGEVTDSVNKSQS